MDPLSAIKQLKEKYRFQAPFQRDCHWSYEKVYAHLWMDPSPKASDSTHEENYTIHLELHPEIVDVNTSRICKHEAKDYKGERE